MPRDVRARAELRFEPISGSAGAVPVRVAALHDEARLDAVERQAVVKTGLGQFDERSDVQRRVVGEEREDDVAVSGRDAGLRFVRARAVGFEPLRAGGAYAA